jgi:hypothetical protein
MALLCSVCSAGELPEPKAAEMLWDGKTQVVTFYILVKHKPIEYEREVRWIARVESGAAPVEQGGDGVKEIIFYYQFKDGSFGKTVGEIWRDPQSVKVDPSPDGTYPPVKISRIGDILHVAGTVLSAPPPWFVAVSCDCSGTKGPVRYIRVMMDGKTHYHEDK